MKVLLYTLIPEGAYYDTDLDQIFQADGTPLAPPVIPAAEQPTTKQQVERGNFVAAAGNNGVGTFSKKSTSTGIFQVYFWTANAAGLIGPVSTVVDANPGSVLPVRPTTPQDVQAAGANFVAGGAVSSALALVTDAADDGKTIEYFTIFSENFV